MFEEQGKRLVVVCLEDDICIEDNLKGTNLIHKGTSQSCDYEVKTLFFFPRQLGLFEDNFKWLRPFSLTFFVVAPLLILLI